MWLWLYANGRLAFRSPLRTWEKTTSGWIADLYKDAARPCYWCYRTNDRMPKNKSNYLLFKQTLEHACLDWFRRGSRRSPVGEGEEDSTSLEKVEVFLPWFWDTNVNAWFAALSTIKPISTTLRWLFNTLVQNLSFVSSRTNDRIPKSKSNYLLFKQTFEWWITEYARFRWKKNNNRNIVFIEINATAKVYRYYSHTMFSL